MQAITTNEGLTTFNKDVEINPFEKLYITFKSGSKESKNNLDLASSISVMESKEFNSLTESLQDVVYLLITKFFLTETMQRLGKGDETKMKEFIEIIMTYLISIKNEEKLN